MYTNKASHGSTDCLYTNKVSHGSTDCLYTNKVSRGNAKRSLYIHVVSVFMSIGLFFLFCLLSFFCLPNPGLRGLRSVESVSFQGTCDNRYEKLATKFCDARCEKSRPGSQGQAPRARLPGPNQRRKPLQAQLHKNRFGQNAAQITLMLAGCCTGLCQCFLR